MHTLHRHSVVEGGAAATDRTVTLQLDEVRLCCLSDELGLKRIIAADAEGHVDLGAILLFHVVLVVSFSAINIIVKNEIHDYRIVEKNVISTVSPRITLILGH